MNLSINNVGMSFGDFIMVNKDFFLNKYIITKTIVTEDIFGKSEAVKKLSFNDEIVDKWKNTIANIFNDGVSLSKDFMDILAIYCELVHSYIINIYKNKNHIQFGSILINDLFKDSLIEINKKLKDIKKIILNKGNRLKIIDRYYNYNTGLEEYLLENGEYVPVGKNIKKLIEVDLSLLPSEVLLIIDIAEYRNQKINQII